MSTFTYTADFGSTKAVEPAVRITKFGDGYEQRQALGLNNVRASWDLTFGQRENVDAQAIVDFLEARAGVESFTWTPPYEVTAIKVVCRTWSRTHEKATRSTVTAKFERVFEP